VPHSKGTCCCHCLMTTPGRIVSPLWMYVNHMVAEESCLDTMGTLFVSAAAYTDNVDTAISRACTARQI
jgi:hypothetical protein